MRYALVIAPVLHRFSGGGRSVEMDEDDTQSQKSEIFSLG
jgi:hypothetical protein